jgi:hypothetical protein
MMILKKWLITAGAIVVLLLVGGLVWAHHSASTATTSTANSQSTKKTAKHTTPPLTLSELKASPKLTYSCLIYYAIKDTKLQRWQEVNDFQAGWQVEHFAKKHPTRYLVWSDMNITSAEKNLAPNWFSLSGDKVTYDSMIVHSFHKDQTAITTLAKVIKKLNADHAMKKVRSMPTKMTLLNHR